MIGEDLNLKPSTAEQAKFEYSPLGKIFNKGLSEEDKKQGILKRLENIKDKNKELLNAFSTTNKVSSASKNKTNKQNKILVYNSQHSFTKFKDIDEFKGLSLESMHARLKNFNEEFVGLKNLNAWTENNKELKNVLNNAGDLYNDQYYIYKDKYNKEMNRMNKEGKNKFDYKQLRLTDGYQYPSEEEQEKEELEEELEKDEKEREQHLEELFIEYIKNESRNVNHELFKHYFEDPIPSVLIRKLYKTKNRKRNNKLVKMIKSGLNDLKEDTSYMSKEKKELQNVDRLIDIVGEILEFNNQQQGKGLKSLTPNQMLSRLPISLAQSNAGNNSEKLKNEIRQILYSL